MRMITIDFPDTNPNTKLILEGSCMQFYQKQEVWTISAFEFINEGWYQLHNDGFNTEVFEHHELLVLKGIALGSISQ